MLRSVHRPGAREVRLQPMTSRRDRLASRREDITVIQQASKLVADLGIQLDLQLENERRPAERMRMLRETTNRITRAANDAVSAYTRSRRLLRVELERPEADVKAINLINERLDAARGDLLQALKIASQRYPTTDLAAARSEEAAE